MAEEQEQQQQPREGKPRQLFVEFQQHSQDFLLLLGEKSRQAGKSKTAAEELSVMEFFWDGVDAIFKEYEKQLHIARIRGATDHMLLGMVEQELRNVYNALFQMSAKYKDEIILNKLMKKTMIPSKEELSKLTEKDLIFKTPDEQHERNLAAIKEVSNDDGRAGHSEHPGQP
jgi:hypothetical protein